MPQLTSKRKETMCLIIAPGKDGKPALLPRDVFDYAYSRNDDGFGGMWIEDGRVNHFKGIGLTADEIYNSMEERVARNPEAIFHMRFKTHGKIIPGLAHPFRILNKSRHGKDMFFMHNGVLGSFGNHLTYGQSDTTAFKDKVLIPLLTRDPDALDDPAVWAMINRETSGSRLVFMDSDGKTYFTSPGSWNTRYGLHLSNTYMLPAESYNYTPTTPTSSDIGSRRQAATAEMTVTAHYTYFRRIDKAGVVAGHWVSCPKIGYVRTESGLLYKDNGPNRTIYHAANYIPKDNEFRHLGMHIVTPTTEDLRDFGSPVMDNDDDLPFKDDVLPFDLGSPSVDRSEAPSRTQVSGPAPEDQRLRYARLVHNMQAGNVTSRPHLMADLIGMNDSELCSFVLEDPENTTVAFAELVEMVLEYNDALWNIDANHELILNPDELCRIGQTDYHRDAVLEIQKIRRDEYHAQLEQMFGDDDDAPAEEVNVA
jgi:predicted glutamine amidotransferase